MTHPKLSILLTLIATPLFAGQPAASTPDKSGYNLFTPTPRELMREFSTDRPDLTESPFTVDAGHLQVEMDLANFTYDRYNSGHDNTRVESWSFGAANFRVGLLPNLDFQVIVPLHQSSREHNFSTGRITRNEGFGDVTLRLKMNFWGNDGGKTAFGIMPFVILPTATGGLGNGEVEGGLIIPFAMELPHGWDLGTMVEFKCISDGDSRGHHLEEITSLTLGHNIAGKLAGYMELASVLSAEQSADWIASFDCGLTYGLTDSVQLDAGVNVGLTRAADDLNPFVGISWRF